MKASWTQCRSLSASLDGLSFDSSSTADIKIQYRKSQGGWLSVDQPVQRRRENWIPTTRPRHSTRPFSLHFTTCARTPCNTLRTSPYPRGTELASIFHKLRLQATLQSILFYIFNHKYLFTSSPICSLSSSLSGKIPVHCMHISFIQPKIRLLLIIFRYRDSGPFPSNPLLCLLGNRDQTERRPKSKTTLPTTAGGWLLQDPVVSIARLTGRIGKYTLH